VFWRLFLFGTARVGEFLDKVSRSSASATIAHILTQATAYVKEVEAISKRRASNWTRRPTR